ncbi:probable serine/threonine-protein kinase PBL24 [Papaver somniferum]|uniref:probable serine/threonine-protein kinase PBL24 n=1 Tax=Papaver somniferum TaxID=3469 RepID=UPI000E6FFEDE|nr:probable serine/threonine-protein kinase PBL24 [Papaver somniferum]
MWLLGGYSKFYKGNLQDGREVAIKKHVKMEEPKAFWDEIDVLQLEHLRHPNIIRMIGDNLMMVMELMPLKSLDKSLFDSTGQLLDWDARLKIAEGVAIALQYLHSQDVVVRDVKPHNFLLSEDFDAKLADFGAAILNSSRTSNSSGKMILKGTRGYMDPEEYRGKAQSPKQDVYSFGMVLFELMTGRRTTALPPPVTHLSSLRFFHSIVLLN